MRRITTFARGSSVPAATLNSMQDNAVGLRRASGAPSGALALAGRVVERGVDVGEVLQAGDDGLDDEGEVGEAGALALGELLGGGAEGDELGDVGDVGAGERG